MDSKIVIKFLGTGSKYTDVKAYESKYSENVGRKMLNGYTWYYFNGPNLLNIGKRSTSNIFDEAKKVVPEILEGHGIKNNSNTLDVMVAGHSRGGGPALQLYKFILEKYKSSENLTINFSSNDSYFGPTAKGENAVTRLNKKPEDEKLKRGHSVAVYSVRTLFRCTPQQIVNPDVIIILNGGHNDVARPIFNVPKTNGLYIAEIGNYNDGFQEIEATKIENDESSINKYFEFIKKNGKVTQTNRWRLFVTILIERLKMNYDQLESISKKSTLFPNVKKELDTAIKSIEKSTNLTSAFRIANKLFSQGGIFSGMGGSKFRKSLKTAQEAVCGAKNNNYSLAIEGLKNIKKNRSKRSIKYMVADALIVRIIKWYKLPEQD